MLKPHGGHIPNIRAWDKVVAKFDPTFGKSPSPMDFTGHKAQGKSYHEPGPKER
jgi:hypothetical protein